MINILQKSWLNWFIFLCALIGAIIYLGYSFFQNYSLQANVEFNNLAAFSRYILGWIIILAGIYFVAFLNYKFVFLKLFLNENPSFKLRYWAFELALTCLIFKVLQYRTDYEVNYADENLVVTAGLMTFIVIYAYIADYFRTKRQQILLLKQKTDAELLALKAQINPHFLFNSLNAIYSSALKEADDETAQLVQQLSGVFRFVVEESQREKISITQEIQFLEKYISLQKARLPNRPNIKVDILIDYDEQLAEISPLLLIPFVENAFQYSISMEQTSYIMLHLIVENRHLEMRLQNSIQPNFQRKKGVGTGILNTRKRLDLLYPNKHKLLIANNINDFSVNLTIEL